MNIALFESRDEAEGFQELLADVDGIESIVVPAREAAFAVEVLRPADFRAGLIYLLYYVKGWTLDALAEQPRDARIEVLATHLLQYAIGERKWNPPDLSWYGRRARLDDSGLAQALETAETEFKNREKRAGWFRRLLRR